MDDMNNSSIKSIKLLIKIYNDCLKTISLTAEFAGVLKSLANDQDTTIITNNGKFVVMALLESGLRAVEQVLFTFS